MKRYSLTFLFILLLACTDTNNVEKKNKNSMFKIASESANFCERHNHKSIVFDNKIWVIGGGFETDVWSSKDGIVWDQVNPDADFSKYFGHTVIVFDNKLWVIAGHSATKKKNDVWYSSDGKKWKCATMSAGFSPRANHTSVVFDKKMWVIGGIDINERAKNDVWFSSDGIKWECATHSAAFLPRFDHTSVVFHNKMWVIGGAQKADKLNAVWCSINGKDWVKATGDAFSLRSMHTSVVFKNKIWVIGGSGDDGFMVYKNDAWYSDDGAQWKELDFSTGFSKRYGHTSVVFDDKIWVIGGRGGKSVGDFKNDVWYSSQKLEKL